MTASGLGRRTARQVVLGLVAVAIAAGLSAAPPAAGPANAATPDLTIVGDARYDVQPDDRRVRVNVKLAIANHLHDTVTRRYYFDRAYLDVLPGTTGFKLTGGSGKPSVRVVQKRTSYTRLLLTFGQRIYSGKSATLQLRFDLPDRGGAATRDVRIGTALVSFPVWAFGSAATPGSRVSIVFPAGYSVHVEAGELPEPTTDAAARTIIQTPKLGDPLKFFAYLVGDRPSAYSSTDLTVGVGEIDARLTIRAWPDDPEWSARVADLFGRGLPILGDLVGLPWPRPGPLVVQEAVSRTTGGYAGLFDPREGRIEVAYYADTFVILHEAAHSWFNGALLADRWANEAFASYYAASTAARLKEKVAAIALTDELRAARIPLNAWAAVGRDPSPGEDYAYAAALELARQIARRAGDDGLRRVWAAAAAQVAAYQPPLFGTHPDAEQADGPPDWRGLLDLLEDRTGESYDDLWRSWVARPNELAILDARHTARSEYVAVVRLAGRWALPRSIRDAMRAWQFDQATELLADARRLLDRRAELEAAAADAGLSLPSRLETIFEAGGFTAATAEADAEAATIATVVEGVAARPAEPGPLVQLGLLAVAPDTTLAAARSAFTGGDLAAARRAALDARETWLQAEDVGRRRLLAGIGLAILALLAVLLLASSWRGRRGRGRPRGAAPASIKPPGAGPSIAG